ncbi:Oligopeptide transporter, OPT family OS=Tsukamurella paurometabola (strain ATCC 8368 / DSM /CCUG 35730 / CIP 100753 / JCM 10117 / KCTC 9821 / NBRC 16120/ NCIMB 702349 / NCTC 13040) OX=521096 GN=Tpau_4197 PE=4 SV=1 [Tsukamurella paurometabola]|uniref:Oligopeptide transporter, OPT family n=1 Tax=Tsukamurella paurometabola (strain ATCC 8368 / DSM 20162 / CCUG 35730 / CIP 100753 / JCM 10117 / KCTC 9821 / NBRC 16120 / NCIMB 702349 / NCTC 13040) TaxID=521096 RepID=D5UP57_TSUPD|nr:oligopeptide transporter, OPT family [Tsukamurella paurometabola]ADG80766.1 oligopeptide transporter, OPT family [Tsukamurella paurometabola DSM 20162]SUP40896.1 oligopeptide transporter, OPT family [Tsukamurella paurometabola]
MSSPASAAPRSGVHELTVRGIALGAVITLVFTAANAYLGLKVGLTFATSIPAAVISMALLRYFANHSIIENNIVQTIASAAGTLSAIVFILPGLVMIGWWQGFPYWTTTLVCLVGGVLGVMYSIPLRRALVTGSDLPFPEGVAAAEVLKVGDTAEGAQENKTGLRLILLGSLASAGYALLGKMKVVAESISIPVKIGSGGTIVVPGLSFALIGVGHLVGVTVGIAMIVGLVISYFVLLPIWTSGELGGGEAFSDVVNGIFKNDIRLIGAGAIAVAAVWTLVKILGPVLRGVAESIASARKRRDGELVDITERDIPFPYVAGIVLVSMVPIGVLLWLFTTDTPLDGKAGGIITLSVLFVLVLGLLVASVCGYMAGLIGASNSPISGVGILVVLAAALLIRAVYGPSSGDETIALVAYTLFTGAIVFGIATISNDNLQDLKTGQLVGATPWKQQVALVIGVAFGSAIIPPVLGVLQKGFGFAGAPGAGDNALAAPQASLLAKLSEGVFGGDLDWGLIGLGALIGVVVIVIDETLARSGKFRLPPLAVGMGMYLPMSVTLMIPIGAAIGYYYNRWADRSDNAEGRKRLGTLMATGLIVGESLFGVLYAGIVVLADRVPDLPIIGGKEEPLALPFIGEGYLHWGEALGAILFAAIVYALYTRTKKVAAAEA